ncbi:hypothetical protein D3C80_1656410 [compost metagenome]
MAGIELRQFRQVIVIIVGAVLGRHAALQTTCHRRLDRMQRIRDFFIDKAAAIAHIATGHAPNERPIAGIVFFDTGFLFNYLWAI